MLAFKGSIVNNNEILAFIKDNFIKIEVVTTHVSSPHTGNHNDIGFLTVGARGKGGGNSKKTQNITLNLKDACLALADKGLLIAGAMSLNSAIAILGACLLTLNEFTSRSKIELTETESLIVFSLYILSMKLKAISLDQLKQQIKSDASKGLLNIPSNRDVEVGIDKLTQIKAIKVHNGNIQLIEEVCIKS